MNLLEASRLKLRIAGDLLQYRAYILQPLVMGTLSPVEVGSGMLFVMMYPMLYHFDQLIPVGRLCRFRLDYRMVMLTMVMLMRGVMMMCMLMFMHMLMLMRGAMMMLMLVTGMIVVAVIMVTMMIMVVIRVMMAHVTSSFVAIDPICRLC